MRTICFLKSRRGIELIQRFTRMRLEERGRADLAEVSERTVRALETATGNPSLRAVASVLNVLGLKLGVGR